MKNSRTNSYIGLGAILAAALFLNGTLDRSRPIRITETVVGKVSVGHLPHLRRLVVASWRGGRTIERIPVDENDYDRLQIGDKIIVQVQKGAFGIPWVNAVFRP